MKLSSCKGCGNTMLWIKTVTGEEMPCDPGLITAKGDEMGLTLILDNGVVVIRPAAGTVGWISHFATCETAKAFRTEKR